MSVITTTVTVECDRCDERVTFEIPHPTETYVDSGLREFGWRSGAGLADICPKHPRVAPSVAS